VVEIGSFVGAFLDACVQNAWDAAGVDIGEETVAFCRERGLTVEKSQLSQVAKPKSLDAIFIWNTFDQVADPGQLLEQASAALKPQGLLVLRIPNGEFKVACTELEKSARWRERALTAEAYNNFLTFPYLAGYSAGALGQLLHRHGFELQQINGDTILPLATKDTRAFAVEEEKRYKRAVARMAKRLLSDSGRNVFPWLDVYAHPFS
jgi:SAM-dependent methyltransferase